MKLEVELPFEFLPKQTKAVQDCRDGQVFKCFVPIYLALFEIIEKEKKIMMRRTVSDPSFDRDTLHGHFSQTRKAKGQFLSHTHPHLPKLPDFHPEHFDPSQQRYPETVWSVIRRVRFPKHPGAVTSHVTSELARAHWEDAQTPYSILAIEIWITAFLISFGVISFWRGTCSWWCSLERLAAGVELLQFWRLAYA